jgi:hypothetical protein
MDVCVDGCGEVGHFSNASLNYLVREWEFALDATTVRAVFEVNVIATANSDTIQDISIMGFSPGGRKNMRFTTVIGFAVEFNDSGATSTRHGWDS